MRSTIRGLRIAVIFLACYWTLLFIGTHIPANAIMHKLHVSDKFLHIAAFAGLAFLMAWAFPTNKNRLSQNVVVSTLVAVVYAAIDELLQIPVGRNADVYDFCADLIGILIGIILYTSLRSYLIRAKIGLLQSPVS